MMQNDFSNGHESPSAMGVLADINDVAVDKGLSREERIAEFVRQIGNPYCFRCGKFTVRVHYAQNGVTLEDCLKSILA